MEANAALGAPQRAKPLVSRLASRLCICGLQGCQGCREILCNRIELVLLHLDAFVSER